MGRFLAKTPAHVRRAERLILFCKEIKRALLNRCVDYNVPIREIDFFVEDLFVKMEFHSDEYDFQTLLTLLLSDEFREGTFRRYRERL